MSISCAAFSQTNTAQAASPDRSSSTGLGASFGPPRGGGESVTKCCPRAVTRARPRSFDRRQLDNAVARFPGMGDSFLGGSVELPYTPRRHGTVTAASPMAKLTLSLFGPGVLTLEGRAVRLHSSRTLALLAYLAVESDRAHNRGKLAALLWGRSDEAAARQSLRQALYSLKTAAAGIADCLGGDQDLVRLQPRPDLDIDVHQFLRGVGDSTADGWRRAALLYRGALLEGRSFPGCEEFEAWLGRAQERMRSLAIRNAERLTGERIAQGDAGAALRYAQLWRDLDPASEVASRQIMRLLAAHSEPHAVDAEWTRLSGLLQRELQVEPARETQELYRMLRRAGIANPAGGGEVESLVKAARAAERVYAFGNAVELYDRALRLLKHVTPADPARYSDLLLLKEQVLERLGRRDEQAAVIDEAICTVEPLGNPAALAAVLLRRAGASVYLGNHAEGLQAAQHALELYRQIGDAPGEAEALREMGFAHWRAQSYPMALQCAREALSLHRRLGDAAGEASALHNLAEIHRGLGSPQQALEWYRQALQLHWATRNPAGEILTLFGMANALHQAGELDLARKEYEKALRLSERHGERTMQSRALHALAVHCAERKDFESALRLMQRAVEVDRAIGYAHALGHDLLDLSHLHLVRGERAEARAALQEALVWFGYTGDEEALALARARLERFDSPGAEIALDAPRGWVKS
ncbi:MAG TPA: tetratricopeptide repeat protein, partial [Burkholderiales bacterium]|nr:tetratricopeptide repeat protein [Burkholderiales bacterium]